MNIEIILVILGIAVLVLAGVFAWIQLRRQALRRRFGPEYDRLKSEKDSLNEAEQELRSRSARHADLQLRELTDDARQRYASQWRALQIRFIDSPDHAVGEADELVTRLIADRGYPTGDFDEQAAMLSVEHARTLTDYRTAHDIADRHTRGEADTEELRKAIVHYRTVVTDLLGEDPVEVNSGGDAMQPSNAASRSRPKPARRNRHVA